MNESSREKYLKDIDYFSKKLEEDPASRLFMPLAFALLKLGRYDETIDVCKKVWIIIQTIMLQRLFLQMHILKKGCLKKQKIFYTMSLRKSLIIIGPTGCLEIFYGIMGT